MIRRQRLAAAGQTRRVVMVSVASCGEARSPLQRLQKLHQVRLLFPGQSKAEQRVVVIDPVEHALCAAVAEMRRALPQRAVDDEDGTGVAFVEYSLNGGAWQRYTGTLLVSTQGTTVVRARATDRAGNAENPGVSSTFMIDSVAPAITVGSPAATEYLHTATLQVSYGATDSLSGLASLFATLDGVAVTNGQTIQLLTLPLGVHIFSVSASDRAGNTSALNLGFTVVATIDTLIGAVDTFIAAGQIDASAGRSLLSKLEDAKQALSRGNLTGARSKLTDFRNQVSAQTGQSISPAAAQLLIADADYVIGTLH